MDGLTRRQFTADSGVKYVFWTSPAKPSKPTLLLLHGCPDIAHLWSNLINSHLQADGYGVLAPDLVGYGESDKPAELERYDQYNICTELAALLSHEKLDRVIVVGHDFGAFLASRMYTFFPDRIAGIVTLGTAYTPPTGEPFDLNGIMALQKQYLGYSSMEYFPLFLSEEGAGVVTANVAEMFTALHGGGERMKSLFCVPGALEKWLADPDNKSAEMLPYAQDARFREQWISRLSRDGGWEPPLTWYKALAANLNVDTERKAVEEGRVALTVPYLFVAATKDPLAPKEAVQGLIAQSLVPDVVVSEVEAGHWCMLEKPEEVGKAVVGWLVKMF